MSPAQDQSQDPAQSSAAHVFTQEVQELLAGIEELILEMEVSATPQLLDALLRPIRLIAVTAARLQLEAMAGVAGEMEGLLTDIETQRISPGDPAIIDGLLTAVETLVNLSANQTDPPEDNHQRETESNQVRESLATLRRQKTKAADAPAAPDTVKTTESTEPTDAIDAINTINTINTTDTTGTGPPPDATHPADIFPGEMKMEFAVEGEEHLAKIEHLLLTLEKMPNDTALLHPLFRSLHSLKGNAGVILSVLEERRRAGHFLNTFKKIAHLAESMVQDKRDTHTPLEDGHIDLLLAVADTLSYFLSCFKDNRPPSANDKIDPTDLITRLSQTTEADEAPKSTEAASSDGKAPPTPPNPTETKKSQPPKDKGGASMEKAVAGLLEQGLDAIGASLKELPDPKKHKTALKKMKRGYKNLQRVGKKIHHELLAAVCTRSLHRVSILEKADPKEWPLLLAELNADYAKLTDKADRRKDKNVADRRGTPPPAQPPTLPSTISPPGNVLKVSQEKIETFMNLIGELLVKKNDLDAFQREMALTYDLPHVERKLKEMAGAISRISNDLQANIMAIRLLPIYGAFSRFPRMIRDMSRKLNKKIKLEIRGEDTEVDKRIIDILTDPLVHMVRNAADHGIESPAQRLTEGKPEEGTITLEAFNRGRYVMVRVSDDGAGMDTEQIIAKATEKGLVTPEQILRLDRPEILHLIFLPGFSMAAEVSDVSGRGVGMDVVQTNIHRLNGEVLVESESGKGTTITIKLPLTMAIGRGLEVESYGNRYLIPLENVIETLRLPSSSVMSSETGNAAIIRGEGMPLFHLDIQLGWQSPKNLSLNQNETTPTPLAVVVLDIKGRRSALVVDHFFNESEYVIKPLNDCLRHIEGISGAMITADGLVNLILDPLRLL